MTESISIIEQINPSWDDLTRNIAPDYLCQITPELVRTRKVIMVIAQDDYDYIGYSLLTPKPGSSDTYCLIHTLVIPENCLDGVATAMLSFAVDKLKKYGIKYLEASVLEEDLEDAIPFLESNGFIKAYDRNIMKYSLNQLTDSELHEIPSYPAVQCIDSVAYEELEAALRGTEIVLSGTCTSLSGVFVENNKCEGFADISLVEDDLRLNSIIINKNADEKKVLIPLCKYACDKLIEAGASSELAEASIIADEYSDTVLRLLGKPEDVTKSLVYTKEL